MWRPNHYCYHHEGSLVHVRCRNSHQNKPTTHKQLWWKTQRVTSQHSASRADGETGILAFQSSSQLQRDLGLIAVLVWSSVAVSRLTARFGVTIPAKSPDTYALSPNSSHLFCKRWPIAAYSGDSLDMRASWTFPGGPANTMQVFMGITDCLK